MTSEFVRFCAAEQIYGEKAFLQLQIGLIEAIKKSKNFKNIRNDSYMLKVILKSKIEETQQAIDELKRIMPKAAVQDNEPLVMQSPFIDKERLTLEEELDKIRRKLQSLEY